MIDRRRVDAPDDPEVPTAHLHGRKTKGGNARFVVLVHYRGRTYGGCGHRVHTTLKRAASCAPRFEVAFRRAVRDGEVDDDGRVYRARDGHRLLAYAPLEAESGEAP